MYPYPPQQGSMSPRPTPSARQSPMMEEEPDGDEGYSSGPANPAMQFAGMSPDMLATGGPMDGSMMSGGSTGTPGPIQSETQPAMGGAMSPGMGSDMLLDQARGEFMTVLQQVMMMAQNYPMAAEPLSIAQQGLTEAMLLVGQAIQQPPVAPQMGA